MLLSFVIPALNEQDCLKQLYQEILANLQGHQHEIIFVDDGSTDRSCHIMSELAATDPQVKIIRFRKNFGKAAALQAGFQIATGEIVFTMDADLQDNPIEIPRFLAKLEEGFDLVSGWKQKRHDPLHKTVPSKLFNAVTAKTFGLKLQDYNCGFKAYRNSVIKELDVYGEMHRYIPALAFAKGYRIGQIPVLHRARTMGKSKYGFERYLRGLLDLLTVKLVTHYARSPLYLFGGIGFITGSIGFILGLYLSIMKIFYNMPLYNRPLLFLSVLLVMVGLQFFSIGLLGELIVNQARSHNRFRSISIAETVNVQHPELLTSRLDENS